MAQEPPDTATKAFQFFAAFYKTGRSLTDYLDPLLESHFDLNLRDYIILSSIYRGTHYPTELAESFNMPKDMVSRIINKLLAVNLIQRSIDPQDSRRTRLEINDKGQEIRNQIRSRIQETIGPLLEHLGNEESTQLINSLSTLANLINTNLIDTNLGETHANLV